jgi:hypothetical protein
LGKQNETVFFTYDKEDPDDPKYGWVKKQAMTDEKANYSFILHQKPSDGSINIMRSEIVLKDIKEATFLEYLYHFDK